MKSTLLICLSLLSAAAAGALAWAGINAPGDRLILLGIGAGVFLLSTLVGVETLDLLRADLRARDRHLADRRQEMTILRSQLASRENEAARLKRQLRDFHILN